jgi:signal transduction histidine kinase
MKIAAIPENEPQRIKALHEYEILDTPAEAEFDEVVKLASQICNVPMSLITLIDNDRQWFKAKLGIDLESTGRKEAFCSHAILGTELFEITDATKDDRFVDNPLVVNDPNIRFYAGVPLVTTSGFNLGTLCVLDSKPRQLSEEQSFALSVLANQVIKLFELRLKNKALQEEKQKLNKISEQQNKIISMIAHDVRGPLASLKSIITLGQSRIISKEEEDKLMGMASAQLDTTIDLLTNLVDWGKMNMEDGTAQFSIVNLFQLVQQKMNEFQVTTSLKGNKLVNLVAEDLNLYTDSHALEFILRNLLTNANKYTQNGLISIIGKKENNQTTIGICDTGIGMTEKIKNRLFSGSYVESQKGTSNEKGSGLGLTLVKDFVNALNGTISVESELDKGTTIWITF